MEIKTYADFTTEDFILDKEFVCWVLLPDKESDLFWQSFLKDHPEKGEQIRDAALIVRSLKPIESEVSESNLNTIFRNIEDQLSPRIAGSYRWMRYAAGIALVIAAGTLIWMSVRVNKPFPIEASNIDKLKGKVILANGSTKEFETEKTIIKQTASGELTINNDTIELKNTQEVKEDAPMNQVIIPYGKRSEITLADGTHIWLNSGSQLSYPSEFSSKSREVYLSGEAFFDVTPDAHKPFFVVTRDFKIRVLGTQFNVSSYSDDKTVQTVLVKGKVVASKNKLFAKTIELEPGERIVYNKDDDSMVKDKVDVQLYASWVNGYLIFENEPTTEVFKKLERYYNQHIIVDEGLEKNTFSGKLDLKDNIRDVLENISFASSVKISETEGVILIK